MDGKPHSEGRTSMNTLLDKNQTALPSKEDSDLAREASRAMSKTQSEELRVRFDNTELVLPKAATKLIHHLLTEMAAGNAVTIIPIHAELTTQESADFLNVSRPYFIRLLEEKKIPFHKVGTHRRVRFEDLVRFKDDHEKKRLELMQELASQSQALRLGY